MMLNGSAAEKQAAQQIMDAYLGSGAILTDGVMNKVAFLTLRILSQGQADYVDPRSQKTVDLSYLDSIPAGNLAARKTGNSRWSQASTANGIQDIVDHLNATYASILQYPPSIGMTSKTWMDLRNQNTTRETVLRGRGIVTDLSAAEQNALVASRPPTTDEVGAEISARLSRGDGSTGTVSIKVSDCVYYEEALDGSEIIAPYMVPDTYFYLWPGMAEQAIVPSAANDYAGGVAVNTEVLRKDPREEELTCSVTAIPLVPDPRLIGFRKVE